MASTAKTGVTIDTSGIKLKLPATPSSFITPAGELLTNRKLGLIGISANATHIGTLEDVLSADTGLTLSTSNSGANEFRSLALDNKELPLDISGTAGENLAARDMVYLNPTNNKWYKQDNNATAPVLMGILRGCVPSAINADASGAIRLRGKVTGFSGLSAGGKLWASSTAGGYTQTKPFAPSAGTQIILSEMGFALSTTVAWIEPTSLRYLKRADLADDGEMTIEHHADAQSYGRKLDVNIRTAIAGSLIDEYDESNRDTNLPLKGPDGLPSASDSNTTNNTVNLIGDDSDERVSMRFRGVDARGSLLSFMFRLSSNTGSPSGTMTWEIHTDNAGVPSGTILASGTLTPTASANNTVTIKDGIQTNGSTFYHFVLRSTTPQANGVYWRWLTNTTNVYDSTNSYICTSGNGGASWSTSTRDAYFTFSTAGFPFTLNNMAQSFQLSGDDSVSKVRLYMRKIGSPTGNLTVKLCNDSGSNPGTTIATSNVVAASSLTGTMGWVDFEFDGVALTGSTTYWILLETTDSQSNTNYVAWSVDRVVSNSGFRYNSNQTGQFEDFGYSKGVYEIYGAETVYYSKAKVDRWTGDLAYLNRFDNGTGSDATTKTTIKNTTGGEQTVIASVTFER